MSENSIKEICVDGMKLDKYPKLKTRIEKINENLPENTNIYDILFETECSLMGPSVRNVLFGISALPIIHLVCKNKETLDSSVKFLTNKGFKPQRIAENKVELLHSQEDTIAIMIKAIDKPILNHIDSFYISANKIYIDSKLKIYWMNDALNDAISGRYVVCKPSEVKIIKTIEHLNSIGFRMKITSAQKMVIVLGQGNVKITENIML